MPELRHHPRVAYRTKVRMRAPGRDHSVVARVHNLSATGIYVTGPDLPAAGTDVLLKIVLGGASRVVRGTVAWVKGGASPSGLGAGIRFVELTAKDETLISSLLEPSEADRQPVDLWLGDLGSAVRADALVQDEIVSAVVRVPFLEPGAPVKARFVRRGVEEIREGVVESVTAEPGVAGAAPTFRVVVSTPPPESAKGVIEVPDSTRDARHTPSPVVPGERTLIDASVLMAPGAVPDAVEESSTDRVQIAYPAPRAGVIDRIERIKAALPAPARSLVPWLGGAVVGALAVTLLLPARGDGGYRPAASAVARAVAAPAPAAPAPVVASAPAAPVAVAEPLVEPNAGGETDAAAARGDAPARRSAFEVVEQDGTPGALLVSFSGSARGATSYRLGNPSGLAVLVPQGRVRASRGAHRPGVFRVVLVKHTARGSELRFMHARSETARMKVEGDTLRVTLARR